MTEHGLLAQALVEDVTTHLAPEFVYSLIRTRGPLSRDPEIICICLTLDAGFREGNLLYQSIFPHTEIRWFKMAASNFGMELPSNSGFLILQKVPFKI